MVTFWSRISAEGRANPLRCPGKKSRMEVQTSISDLFCDFVWTILEVSMLIFYLLQICKRLLMPPCHTAGCAMCEPLTTAT